MGSTLTTPALSGGESVITIAREPSWGTPPTSGTNPNKAFGSEAHPAKGVILKEETFAFNKNADPQTDDLDQNREISRIIENGNTVSGGLRGNCGPESIGYFLTMLFGTPQTTQVADSAGGSDNDVYQHIFYPGLNTRANWPASYAIESRLSSERSKLITGVILGSLGIEVGNNSPFSISADGIAKAIQILQGADTSGTTDDEGIELPCILTANPTMVDEGVWHYCDMKAYPQIDYVDEQSVTDCSFNFGFPDLDGKYTGGSGKNIGTYSIDKFQASGRATILFDNETLWYKIKQGLYFKLDMTFEGAVIQGAHKNSLKFELFSCKAPTDGVTNRVGALTYDFDLNCRKDPTEGKSCQITLINSVASYAA